MSSFRKYGVVPNNGKENSNSSREAVDTNSGSSVGLGSALTATWVGVLLGTSEGRTGVVVWSEPEGYDSVDLKSKEGVGKCLFGASLSMVGTGAGAASGMDAELFLEVMEA